MNLAGTNIEASYQQFLALEPATYLECLILNQRNI